MWKNEIKKDESFGTGVNTSVPDLEADEKIWHTYLTGRFDPFSTSDGATAYQHRLWYGVFIVGRYWFLQGRKEVAHILWSQVIFVTATENGQPVEYIEIVYHYDKSRQVDLHHTTARSSTDQASRIYPNNNDPLCPIKFLKFFCFCSCEVQAT